ncbi:MAG TPA: hypothetical protein VHY30_06805 [Verrucomicrobiae bacterium]|nr:hypothetical protein [Verrucomicrobiae bacterium]
MRRDFYELSQSICELSGKIQEIYIMPTDLIHRIGIAAPAEKIF